MEITHGLMIVLVLVIIVAFSKFYGGDYIDFLSDNIFILLIIIIGIIITSNYLIVYKKPDKDGTARGDGENEGKFYVKLF